MKKCNHFWDIVFPVKDWNNPKWRCVHCPATRQAPIPILDLDDLKGQDPPRKAHVKTTRNKTPKSTKISETETETETWITIDDSKIRHLWGCTYDPCTTEVSPSFYMDNGTPICTVCGAEMKYLRTEIRKG